MLRLCDVRTQSCRHAPVLCSYAGSCAKSSPRFAEYLLHLLHMWTGSVTPLRWEEDASHLHARLVVYSSLVRSSWVV
jgi:hypothetical protein